MSIWTSGWHRWDDPAQALTHSFLRCRTTTASTPVLFRFFHFFLSIFFSPITPLPFLSLFSPCGRCRRHNSLSERRRLTHKSVAGNLAALTERAKHSQAARKFSGSPTTLRCYLIGDLLFLAAALDFFFFFFLFSRSFLSLPLMGKGAQSDYGGGGSETRRAIVKKEKWKSKKSIESVFLKNVGRP